MLWAMNLHVLNRPSLQRVIFGGEECEVLGVLTLARTRVSRRLRGRRYARRGGSLKSIFAAIGSRKDRIIFFNDIIKIWKTWVVGSDKYCTIVGFLVLIVESVFTWDIESFVDLCFDVVSFVTTLTEKFQKFISALFKIVIGGADSANSKRKAVWD